MPSGSPFSLSIPEPEVHVAGDPLGRTYTPDVAALAILKRLALKPWPDLPGRGSRVAFASSFVDPCLGGGSWARAFRAVAASDLSFADATRLHVAGFDLDPQAPGRRDAAPVETRSSKPRYSNWRPCGYPGCSPTYCDECNGEGYRPAGGRRWRR